MNERLAAGVLDSVRPASALPSAPQRGSTQCRAKRGGASRSEAEDGDEEISPGRASGASGGGGGRPGRGCGARRGPRPGASPCARVRSATGWHGGRPVGGPTTSRSRPRRRATVTACSMRSLKWRVLSSGSGRSGEPNVTVVLPGLGRFMPLPRIEPAPSMNTGTTGAPVRIERKAAPPLNGCPQPSGERPPSGKMTRLQPSSMSSTGQIGRLPPGHVAVDRERVEHQGGRRAGEVAREEVVGGGADDEVPAPRLGDGRDGERRVEVAVVVGREDDGRRRVALLRRVEGPQVGQTVDAPDLGSTRAPARPAAAVRW